MNVAVVFHAAASSEATGLFDVWCEFICFIGTLLLLCFALLRLLFLSGGGGGGMFFFLIGCRCLQW